MVMARENRSEDYFSSENTEKQNAFTLEVMNEMLKMHGRPPCQTWEIGKLAL